MLRFRGTPRYGSSTQDDPARLAGGVCEADLDEQGLPLTQRQADRLLEDQQILAVLAYIKSTWRPEVIEQHNQINAAAAGDFSMNMSGRGNTNMRGYGNGYGAGDGWGRGYNYQAPYYGAPYGYAPFAPVAPAAPAAEAE